MRRQFWVVAHRWAGLTLALFLLVVGFTGALLPFEEALSFAGRSGAAYVAPPYPGAPRLDGVTLVERAERQTGGRITRTFLDLPADRIQRTWILPRPGGEPLGYDQVWMDPYTGRVTLRNHYGALRAGAQNIMSFLFLLHYGLIFGNTGKLVFGVAALIWTIDCFVGLYLTFPLSRRQRGSAPHRASWWSRWRPAWRVRRGVGGYKLNFDLHRAGGLWLWPMLFVFAWAAVETNLPQVSEAVTQGLGGERSWVPSKLATRLDDPPIERREAVRTGEQLMAAQASSRGFAVEVAKQLDYIPAAALYRYAARTSLDPSTESGNTLVWFSALDGRFVRFEAPLGPTRTNAVMHWIDMLHRAQVFGLPYRIAVSVIGIFIVVLTVTGILIWTRKRSARLLHGRRQRRYDALYQIPAT